MGKIKSKIMVALAIVCTIIIFGIMFLMVYGFEKGWHR